MNDSLNLTLDNAPAPATSAVRRPPVTPPDAAIAFDDDEPLSDLEEAEAIGAGVSMKLPERRHLVALLTALQQSRVACEDLRDLSVAALEGLQLAAERAREGRRA